MFSVLLLAPLAFAGGSLTCTPVEGPALVYSEGGYQGGAAPGPDMVSRAVSWTLDGASLYASSVTYGGESRVTGDLDWSWDLKSHRSLPADAGAQIYTANATIWTRSGQPLGPTLPEPTWSGTMRCARAFPLALP